MGITGLHPIIKPILKKTALTNYKNKTFGIDGHAWLYQISHIYAEDIYHKIPITKHAKRFLEKINKLRECNIRPVVVFDGDSLKAKEVTNNERKHKKEIIRAEIVKCMARGNHVRAKMLMRQCISIDNDLLAPVLDVLRRENIEFMIAPYESDAQLSFLQKIKYIDCIVTEDSDLVVFGADRILYKFDGSHVLEFRQSMLKFAKDQFFANNILHISILSGCDYLKSVKGVGLLTAYKLMLKHDTVENCLEFLKLNKTIPDNYLEEFNIAIVNFKHHIVYDPIKKQRLHLNSPESNHIHIMKDLGIIAHPDPSGFASGKHIQKSCGPLEAIGALKKLDNPANTVTATRIAIKKNKNTSGKKRKTIVVDPNSKCSIFEDL